MRESRTAGARASSAGAGWYVLLGVAAFALRLVALLKIDGLTYDGTYYLRQAERLRHWSFDFVGFPPGYPFVTVVFQILGRDAVRAGQLVSLFAGFASLYLAHRLARRHLGRWAAFAVVLFLAVNPYLARVQIEVLSESLFLALILAGVLLWELQRDVAAGLCLGAAFLVRPEALVVYAGLLALRAVATRRFPVALAIGLLPIALYSALASRAVGHFVVSPKQGQWDVAHGLMARAATLGSCLYMCFPILLVPGALWIGIRRLLHLLLPVLPLAALPFFGIHVQPRIVTPALPFLAILAVVWLVQLPVRWGKGLGVAAAALFLFASRDGYASLLHSPPLTPHAREIGMALRSHLHFEDRVAGRFPFAAYWAGAGFVRAQREAGYDALVDSVIGAGATHLLVLEGEIEGILPQLKPLFADARFAASEGRMEAVAAVASPPGARAVLYRLHGAAVTPGAASVQRNDIDAATWMRAQCIAATRDGDLVAIGGARAPAAPARAADPVADATGQRLVCLLGAPGAERIAMYRDGRWTEFPQTRADAPAHPTWVAGWIVYVRRAPPETLRGFDPQDGRLRDVQLAELDARVAVPECAAGRDSRLAITYRAPDPQLDPLRVVAVADWPASSPPDGPIRLAGRWATRLRLADPVLCWVPIEDRVIGSLAVLTGEGVTTPERASLCILSEGGRVRRLTYGFVAPRRPALSGGRLAFVTGDGELRIAPLPEERLRIQPVRTFEIEGGATPVVP